MEMLPPVSWRADRHSPAAVIGRRWREALRELALLGTLMGIYEGARIFGGHDTLAALRHARGLLRIEQWLHLPAEQHMQSALLQSGSLTRLANAYYASVHLPLTIGCLLWLALYRREVYRRARRALIAATTVALALYLLMPVAPPRMLPGFVDTAARYGQSVYGSAGSHSLADQYAAFPSLHVGWAALIAVAMIRASRSTWRWLWLVHPLVTTLVVVSTGNHYWLDTLVGAALTLIAFAMCGASSSSGSTAIREIRLTDGTTNIASLSDLRRANLVDVPSIVALMETSPDWPRSVSMPPDMVPAAMRLVIAHLALDQGEVWVLAAGDAPPMAAVVFLPSLAGDGLEDLRSALKIELGVCPVEEFQAGAGGPAEPVDAWAVLQGSRLPAGPQSDAAIAALRLHALTCAQNKGALTGQRIPQRGRQPRIAASI